MNKILFVEDDALVARIYSQKLAEAGFLVGLAEDGLAAMKRLVEFKPDLVVLDLMMPKLSGVDVLKFMRQQPDLKSVPVVVFSNTFLGDLGDEVARLGVEELLAKASVTPALLVETIRRILSRDDLAPSSPADGAVSSPPVPRGGVPARPFGSDSARPEPPQENESSAAFRKRIRSDFFEQIPSISQGVQQAGRDFLEATEPSAQLLRLGALGRKIGFVTHMTGMACCYRIAQLSSALEALLFELQEKPSCINESSRNTVASTLALLISWLANADQPDEQPPSPMTALVVDDDAVSNRATVMALIRASLAAKGVNDPMSALEKLRENNYDVLLVDINLPGMNGFTFCEQMRKLPHHKNTPVVFISSHSEFEPRARLVLGPDDDFIAKPIMPIELTVKVTAHVLKRHLESQKAAR